MAVEDTNTGLVNVNIYGHDFECQAVGLYGRNAIQVRAFNQVVAKLVADRPTNVSRLWERSRCGEAPELDDLCASALAEATADAPLENGLIVASIRLTAIDLGRIGTPATLDELHVIAQRHFDDLGFPIAYKVPKPRPLRHSDGTRTWTIMPEETATKELKKELRRIVNRIKSTHKLKN